VVDWHIQCICSWSLETQELVSSVCNIQEDNMMSPHCSITTSASDSFLFVTTVNYRLDSFPHTTSCGYKKKIVVDNKVK